MSVVCRPARAQDLEFADTLVVSSINHLTERHGFGTMAISSPPKFQSFSLRRRQRTYRTARGLAPPCRRYRVQDGPAIGRRERLVTSVSVPAWRERGGSQHRDGARNADQVSDVADVVA